ncbi:hypothetical protein AVJ23_20010 [Pseudoponticoccus marisrubri]|uniref:Uncharacterized protein n=1 Tax=Pseudoponticoccus marisrubri TaxID=1685382 RepID=A0A0W7WEA3_9RHOB|nr:hypothetical protein AVJ23_20010 [Pseudoponticoccus marisrubri]
MPGVSTAAIHATLERSRPTLGQGVLLLPAVGRFQWWRAHVTNMTTAPVDSFPEAQQLALDGIRRNAERIAVWMAKRPEHTIIVSDEALLADRLAHPGGSTLFDWGARILPAVTEAFAAFDLTYVIYAGDEERWLNDCYRRHAVTEGRASGFRDWHDTLPETLSLTDGLDRLDAVAGAPLYRVTPQEEERAGRAPGSMLLRQAGLVPDPVAPAVLSIRAAGDGVERVVLHVGTHKTGTTSIQVTCHENREALADQGLFYPDLGSPGRHAALSVPFHETLVPRQFHHLFGTDKAVMDEVAQGYWDMVAQQLWQRPGTRTLLLSTEYFTRIDRHDALVAQLRRLCPEARIEAICYLRPAPGYYLSDLQQHLLASGRVDWPVNLDWASHMRAWAATMPLTTRAFEPAALTAGDAVTDFLTWMAGDGPVPELPSSRRNESLSAEAMEILRSYRRTLYPDREDVFTQDSIRLRRLLQEMDARLPGPQGKARATLWPEVRDLAILRNAADLAELRDTFGVTFSDPALYDTAAAEARLAESGLKLSANPSLRRIVRISSRRLEQLHMHLLHELVEKPPHA